MTKKTCAVTGASGFVGGCLRRAITDAGWEVVPWGRSGNPQGSHVRFQLGEPVPEGAFADVDALVHCAYDFGPLQWPEIARVNISGTLDLFRAARAAGVRSIVFISSLSAFEGCESRYGRAKLEIEKHASELGVFVVRPGLVYGDTPGGMFGRLVQQVKSSSIVPVIVGGMQTQYLVHEADLGKLVLSVLERILKPGEGPVSIAHPRGHTLKNILQQIGDVLGRNLIFVPVHWRLLWIALRSIEGAGLRPKFRSDSLIGMVRQNPAPSLALPRALGLECRPFKITPAMVTEERK